MTHLRFPVVSQDLANAFSNFRAEHFGNSLIRLFTEPGYFPELLTPQPCFLIGGRGTGKTTTLRSIAYKGKYEREGEKDQELRDWGYVGLYIKINTSRVSAFRGPEASESEWERLFGHYFNLLMLSAVAEFFLWYRKTHPEAQQPPTSAFEQVARTLDAAECGSAEEFFDLVTKKLIELETIVNSIGHSKKLTLSSLGAPIDALVDRLLEVDFIGGTYFYFILDEYENLTAYQQRVVNTLIKHARPPYTFKVGARELGIRERCTLNISEQLVDPADFRRIDISERLSRGDDFIKFAASVCGKRLGHGADNFDPSQLMTHLFPRLSAAEEADALGVAEHLSEIDQAAKNALPQPEAFLSLPRFERYILWTIEQGSLTQIAAYLARADFAESWPTRKDNYATSALFTIRAKKPGLRKYYAGWKTLCRLSGGNIRYLLELVNKSFQLQVLEDKTQSSVTPRVQTLAAQDIGKKNLRELEGLSVFGAKMARLVLSLGRIFGILAETSSGHAAEMNQFEIKGDGIAQEASTAPLGELMTQAVMHLAVVRFAGTKLQQSDDIRDYDYALHPIFSAFFGYSYRRKRKLRLSHEEFEGLADHPRQFIFKILARHNRAAEDVDSLPEQMELFQEFYRGIR